MALWICGRQRVTGESLRRCEGQHRFRAVSGDSTRRRLLLRPSGDDGKNRGEIFAPHGRAGKRVERTRVWSEEAERLVFSLRQSAKGGDAEERGARGIQNGGRCLAVAHYAEVDINRAVG